MIHVRDAGGGALSRALRKPRVALGCIRKQRGGNERERERGRKERMEKVSRSSNLAWYACNIFPANHPFALQVLGRPDEMALPCV